MTPPRSDVEVLRELALLELGGSASVDYCWFHHSGEAWSGEVYGSLKEANRARVAAVNEAIAAIEVMEGKGWLPIESAPKFTEVLVYDETQEPSVFAATLVDRHESEGGMYWHPSETLVADAMADEFNPTHWQPIALPAPPQPNEEKGNV